MIFALGDRKIQIRGEDYFVAESASVIGSVILENNASIWFNVVVRGDNDIIHIGENSNVQDSAVLHTDPGIGLIIGKNVTVGHQAMLHGCTIGDNSLIGMNAVILHGAIIGEEALVAALSVVPEGMIVPPRSLVAGAPATIRRELSGSGAEWVRRSADHYVDLAARYLAAGIGRVEHP